MYTTSAIDNLLKQLVSQLSEKREQASKAPPNKPTRESKTGKAQGCATKGGTKNIGLQLEPQRFLVALGLLGGVLEVTSMLVDKDQNVQFVLSGSLKRPSRMDKMLDEIGRMPFDEVLKAVIGRLS